MRIVKWTKKPSRNQMRAWGPYGFVGSVTYVLGVGWIANVIPSRRCGWHNPYVTIRRTRERAMGALEARVAALLDTKRRESGRLRRIWLNWVARGYSWPVPPVQQIAESIVPIAVVVGEP